MMKVLVLGCNGMAGHVISLYMNEQGHDVLGFDRLESRYVKSVVGDARDTKLLRTIINEGNFDSVINCIGILNKQAEDNKALATYLNAYLPHLLVEITQGTKTQVIHMSTDCVFSGKRGGYTESDFKDGETFYDRTKALGEIEDAKNVTLRNSIVGPDINPNGIGLLNWFLQQRNTVNGYTGAMWTGQTTVQLAKTMEIVAKERISGLYNMVPSTSISKFDLLMLFNKHLRNNEVKITPVVGINLDKSLLRTRFDFDYIIPDYEVMVSEMAGWIKKHKEMYPHYCL